MALYVGRMLELNLHIELIQNLESSIIISNYLAHAIYDCKMAGIAAIMEMPNPNPQLINESAIQDRVAQINRLKFDHPHHFINIGLTNDNNQVSKAIKLAIKRGPISAIKVF